MLKFKLANGQEFDTQKTEIVLKQLFWQLWAKCHYNVDFFHCTDGFAFHNIFQCVLPRGNKPLGGNSITEIQRKIKK